MPAASHPPATSVAETMLAEIWRAAGGDDAALPAVEFTGRGALPSVFAVTDLAAASIAAAGLAMARWIGGADGPTPSVRVDRRLASFWFAASLRPQGWAPPPLWDAVAGDYQAGDGWIRLHTNAPHHRAAALAVLGATATREAVAHAVARWPAAELESAIVAAHGCAAAMRSLTSWTAHPQGLCVATEPLLDRRVAAPGPALTAAINPVRPLAGIKVLDLTRVLAGPVATRFLAGHGAEVLRIDPPGWDEPNVVGEVVLGKRTARLDLRAPDGRARLLALLAEADIVVHGYRADALERLGLGAAERRATRPGLVDVCLDAYGWQGPWRARRGFDSLVQKSAGIAEAGMRLGGKDKPTPLPVQALDHATGYMMAAAASLGLVERRRTGRGVVTRASLARTAKLLVDRSGGDAEPPLAAESPDDIAPAIESTPWGPARRLHVPLQIAGTPMRWDRGAQLLGSDPPAWA